MDSVTWQEYKDDNLYVDLADSLEWAYGVPVYGMPWEDRLACTVEDAVADPDFAMDFLRWTAEEHANWDEGAQAAYERVRATLVYHLQKWRFMPKVEAHALAGEWLDFSARVQTVCETMPEAFMFFYEDMPEEYRRDFVVGCYMHHGDSVHECREAVTELPRRGTEELPEEYRDQDEITVYRAGEEPMDQAPARISWTLDRARAVWFRDEYIGKHAKHLYQAHIRPCDVIAYNNDRDEQEVLQHLDVYDVEEI